MSFSQVWSYTASRRANELFLIFEGPDRQVSQWTYAEFDLLVGRMAAELQSHGVRPGSSVHLALTNCPTFVAVWIATNRLGAFIVPADPMGKRAEFADQIERTSPVVGLHSGDRAAEYDGFEDQGLAVIAVDEADTGFAWLSNDALTEWPMTALVDTAAVMFTSGTTGRPKGVVITQANYAFAGKVMAEAADLTELDRWIVVLPLFHANAQYYSFASAIWVGASIALMHTFSASNFLSQVVRHEATCASLFAAPIRMILSRSEAPAQPVELRHCWYAQNISDEQWRTFSAWLGCKPRQLYGMTETIAAVLNDDRESPEPDMMGYVTAGCDVEVHDHGGDLAAAGAVGELVVRGECGITLFDRYLDEPATTANSFRNGWFLTGDRATVTTDGRFAFAGRRSDVLKVAGENVSTVEVESVLSSHPQVLEAAVVGLPDPIRDEVPVAYVAAADPSVPPSEAELIDWCAKHLGGAKVPRSVTVVEELPRTSVGKIRKFILQKEGVVQ